jgi:hypothetical protein
LGDTINQVELQQDIARLDEWASKWQMTFNATKCKVMHLGLKNPFHDYTMNQDGQKVILESTDIEKDLGVNIDNQLKFSKHTEIQVNKANKLLGMIRRSYTYLDKESMLTLYRSLIRPHLEYGHVITFPRFEKECKLIEGVQRRATKLVPELRNVDYINRLKAMNLPSMYYRRERGDMIECYKFTHNMYKSTPLLDLDSTSSLRGHSLKLKKHHCKRTVRQHFFSERVVNHWNSLPEEIVSAPKMNTFKNKLDKHWQKYHHSLEPLPTIRLNYNEETDEPPVETVLQA